MSIMYKQLLSIFLYLIHGSYPNKLLNHLVTLVTHLPILILMILDTQTRISLQIEKCLVVVIYVTLPWLPSLAWPDHFLA